MRLALRDAPLLLTTAVMVACGGDSTDPDDVFPDAAGVYQVTGGFDGFTMSAASFSGTLELTQASQESGALEGSIALVVDIGGDIFDVSDDLNSASVQPSGVIHFTTGGGGFGWTFSGTLSGDDVTQGRHTLAEGGEDPISGSWQATRANSGTVGLARRGAERGLKELLLRLDR